MALGTTKKISLDFYNNTITTVYAKQYDAETRYVNVICTDSGKRVYLDQSSMTAYIKGKKPDGNNILNNAEILDDGTVLIELTQQMLASEGRYRIDVSIFNETGINVELLENATSFAELGISVLSTMSFYLCVINSAVKHSEITSTSEYDALTMVLATSIATETRLNELENTISDNEKLRQASEEQRVLAEEQRILDTSKAIQNCQNATSNANLATSNCNNATNAANNATDNCETVTANAADKIEEMEALAERIENSVSSVINDNTESTSTTYSSEKMMNLFKTFFQSSTIEPTNQTVNGIWFIED